MTGESLAGERINLEDVLRVVSFGRCIVRNYSNLSIQSSNAESGSIFCFLDITSEKLTVSIFLDLVLGLDLNPN